jgi:pimeloyl-ACP methyl ester carboxylesterase
MASMPTVRGETTSAIGTQRWTERGSGPPVLLLHGVYAGAGAHEWEQLVPLLPAARTVRTPDLLGFGASDRPPVEFTAELLAEAVSALVGDFDVEGAVVASSLTGAYALQAVARSGRPRRLILITPTGLGSSQSRPPPAPATWLEALWRRTPIGDALVRALVSGPSVRWFLRHQAYADPRFATEEVVRRHTDAGRHPDAKYPLVAFVAGSLALPVDPAAVELVRPTVVWGDGQSFTARSDADQWAAAGSTVLHRPSGMPHVEEPGVVAELLLGGR